MPSVINSDDGVVSGSAGLKTSGANDGITAFQQNGTEQARITSTGDFQFNSGYGSVATAYGCRAWVNFNGTGTVAIRASGNVTSITDNGTGDYTVNFTTAMPDANYGYNVTAGTISGNYVFGSVYSSAPTTSQFRFHVVNPSSTNVDSVQTAVAIFR